MDDCTYNKIKLLHDMSRISGFIEKHCREDARRAKHKDCQQIIDHLHKDLTVHMEGLRVILAKERLNMRKSPSKRR